MIGGHYPAFPQLLWGLEDVHTFPWLHVIDNKAKVHRAQLEAIWLRAGHSIHIISKL